MHRELAVAGEIHVVRKFHNIVHSGRISISVLPRNRDSRTGYFVDRSRGRRTATAASAAAVATAADLVIQQTGRPRSEAGSDRYGGRSVIRFLFRHTSRNQLFFDGYDRRAEAEEFTFRRSQVGGTEFALLDRLALVPDIINCRDPVFVKTSGDIVDRQRIVLLAVHMHYGMPSGGIPVGTFEFVFHDILFYAGLGIVGIAPVAVQINGHIVRIAPVESRGDTRLFLVVLQIHEIRFHIVADPDAERFPHFRHAGIPLDIVGCHLPVNKTLIGQAGNNRLGRSNRFGKNLVIAAGESCLDLAFQRDALPLFRVGHRNHVLRFKVLDGIVFDRIVAFGGSPCEFRHSGGDAGAGIVRVHDIRLIASHGEIRGQIRLQGIERIVVAPIGNNGAVSFVPAHAPFHLLTGFNPLDHITGSPRCGQLHDNALAAVDPIFDLVGIDIFDRLPGQGQRMLGIAELISPVKLECRRPLDAGGRHLHLIGLRIVGDRRADSSILRLIEGTDIPFGKVNRLRLAVVAERDALVGPILPIISVILVQDIGNPILSIIQIDRHRLGTGHGDVVPVGSDDRAIRDTGRFLVQFEADIHLPVSGEQIAIHPGIAVDHDGVQAAPQIDVAVNHCGCGKFHPVIVIDSRVPDRIVAGRIVPFRHDRVRRTGNGAGYAQIHRFVAQNADAVGGIDAAVDVKSVVSAGGGFQRIGGMEAVSP